MIESIESNVPRACWAGPLRYPLASSWSKTLLIYGGFFFSYVLLALVFYVLGRPGRPLPLVLWLTFRCWFVAVAGTFISVWAIQNLENWLPFMRTRLTRKEITTQPGYYSRERRHELRAGEVVYMDRRDLWRPYVLVPYPNPLPVAVLHPKITPAVLRELWPDHPLPVIERCLPAAHRPTQVVTASEHDAAMVPKCLTFCFGEEIAQQDRDAVTVLLAGMPAGRLQAKPVEFREQVTIRVPLGPTRLLEAREIVAELLDPLLDRLEESDSRRRSLQGVLLEESEEWLHPYLPDLLGTPWLARHVIAWWGSVEITTSGQEEKDRGRENRAP
jgi:hypothetical protein